MLTTHIGKFWWKFSFQKKKYINIYITLSLCVCVCVCVFVKEQEIEDWEAGYIFRTFHVQLLTKGTFVRYRNKKERFLKSVTSAVKYRTSGEWKSGGYVHESKCSGILRNPTVQEEKIQIIRMLNKIIRCTTHPYETDKNSLNFMSEMFLQIHKSLKFFTRMFFSKTNKRSSLVKEVF